MLKKLKNLRLCLVLLAFLVTVGVLFGGQKLVAKYRSEDPTRRAIGAIKEVRDFEVKQASDGLTVELKLDKVGNLELLLDEIKQKVEAHYHQPIRNFKITGRPDQQLHSEVIIYRFILKKLWYQGVIFS